MTWFPWSSNPVIRHISLIYVQVSINQSTGLRCCHFCAWEVVVHFVVIYGIADHQCLYRGIVLVSHMWKLFTSLLNNRLTKWSENSLVLTNAQSGFSPGYGNTDAIFSLHSLISKSLRTGKRLYCCFIDYVKTFDIVFHLKLWLRLAWCGVTGKLLNVIKSMYSKLKCCVKFDGHFSNFFTSNIGLMQGESLSTLLYSFYVNDMEIELI